MATEHPTDETWEALATNEIGAAAKKIVMAHVVECSQCARTWRALREVAREAQAFDPGAPKLPAPKPPARRAWLVGAGAALVAAAAIVLVIGRTRPETDDESGVMRGSNEPRVELAEPTAWRPFAGAETYTVDVFSDDGHRVWHRADVTGISVIVEPKLPPAAYRWQVEAWSHGKRIAVSKPGRFTVSP